MPALPALARQLAVIDADLAAGRLDRARSYLDALRDVPGVSVQHLRNCLTGLDHAAAGRMEEADAAFDASLACFAAMAPSAPAAPAAGAATGPGLGAGAVIVTVAVSACGPAQCHAQAHAF